MKTLRQRSRELFPHWTRHQRAKWVRARMIAPDPKVGTARELLVDERNYRFARQA